MEGLIQLLVMVIFGAICATLASKRGRNPTGWFFIGFLAPCMGLILVLVLPDLGQQQERERRLEVRNRRLKEELRLNRRVADERHADTDRRLQVHDRALGVDSSGRGERRLPTSSAPPPPLPASPPPRPPTRTVQPAPSNEQWFYEEESGSSGPVTVNDLATLWRRGRISPETLVWRDGMPEWRAVSDVPSLLAALRG